MSSTTTTFTLGNLSQLELLSHPLRSRVAEVKPEARRNPQDLLAANVTRLLAARGWSEAQLVDAIDQLEDSSSSTLSRAARAANVRRYLRGTRWPGRPETLDLLARALEIEVAELFRAPP